MIKKINFTNRTKMYLMMLNPTIHTHTHATHTHTWTATHGAWHYGARKVAAKRAQSAERVERRIPMTTTKNRGNTAKNATRRSERNSSTESKFESIQRTTHTVDVDVSVDKRN